MILKIAEKHKKAENHVEEFAPIEITPTKVKTSLADPDIFYAMLGCNIFFFMTVGNKKPFLSLWSRIQIPENFEVPNG